MQKNQLFGIREHCYRLSNVLGREEFAYERHKTAKANDGELIDWTLASEWLYLAASVNRVEIDTSKFNDSTEMCRPAWEFESKRSEILSELVKQLAAFNFAWGGMETIAKIIDPPKIPKGIKSNSSLIDEAIFYLKNEYEPLFLLYSYEDALADLREDINALHYYGNLADEFKLRPYLGVSGVGLHVIRLIRNKFAHGTLTMPDPEEWSGVKNRDAHLIETCTRLVLLTIQMLLLAHFKNHQFYIEATADTEDEYELQSIHEIVRTLHYSIERDQNQHQLFAS